MSQVTLEPTGQELDGGPVATVSITESTGLAGGRTKPCAGSSCFSSDNTSTQKWLKSRGKSVTCVTGKARGKRADTVGSGRNK